MSYILLQRQISYIALFMILLVMLYCDIFIKIVIYKCFVIRCEKWQINQ